MSMFDTLPFDRIAPAGFYGVPGETGIVVTVREGLIVAAFVARQGQTSALAARVSAALGLVLPEGPRVNGAPDLALLGVGPGRWLAVSQSRPNLAAELGGALAGMASVTEQSDSLIAFDVEGTRVLDLLAKGPEIDLHPDAFKIGDVAVTDIAHIGATLWRTGASAYRLLIARSFTPAFSRFLVASAAEYGLRLDNAPATGRG